VDAGTATTGTRGICHRQSVGVQPQTLDGADVLPGRWRRAPRQQLGGKPDPTLCLGRSNWLFAGSLRSGQRTAAVMMLIQSAKLNGHDPYGYLKDVLSRLPTHKNNAIDELLPLNWKPVIVGKA
jgi:hypothetical protein